jgi:cation/acetate symporter
MVWGLGWAYLRYSDRVLEPLRERGLVKAARSCSVRRRDRRRRPPEEVRAMTFIFAADLNELALAIFAVVLGITLVITFWASRRTKTTTDFYAASRGITGVQNGFAIAGDYMSAASFLGIAGLIFLYGFDGFLYSVGFLVAFLTVLFLLAERMRNAGKYTMADVLSFRMRQRPARSAAALGTLSVAAFYLIAQMVGAGVLIQALVGIDFSLAVLITGAAMLAYVVFGGMIATTWVQIIKAGLLMSATIVLSVLVVIRVGSPTELFAQARDESPLGEAYLAPGQFLTSPIDTLSLGIALVLGTAGLPHILIRFFTVPTAKAARSSVVWAMALIGAFYIMTTALGFGARAILGEGGVEAAGNGGNLAAPLLAEELGGGAGRWAETSSWRSSPRWRSRRSWRSSRAGDLRFRRRRARHLVEHRAPRPRFRRRRAVGRAHRRHRDRRHRHRHRDHRRRGPQRVLHGRPRLRRGGERELPGSLLALTWKRFNTTGAVTGALVGVISSIALIIVSPKVWPGADSVTGSPIGWTLANPGIVSIPLGFLGCYLGTVLSREKASEHRWHELVVRSETGIGAEEAVTH